MINHKKNNGLRFPEKPPRRHSYMLRCMQSRGLRSSQDGSDEVWLFSLLDPQNGSVMNFSDLDALVSFLHKNFDMD
jgi:hypothetical protein